MKLDVSLGRIMKYFPGHVKEFDFILTALACDGRALSRDWYGQIDRKQQEERETARKEVRGLGQGRWYMAYIHWLNNWKEGAYR